MKKNIRFAIALIFFTVTLYSQNISSPIAVGDVFVVGAVENNNYTYINFPKPNIIIKKGDYCFYVFSKFFHFRF